MQFNEKRYGRTSATIVALIAGCCTASCQIQTKAEAQNSRPWPNSPEAVAEKMWQKILTKCSISGTLSLATFFVQPSGESVAEYRDAWTKLVPEQLTEADRLNGVQYRGFAIVGAPTYRYTPGSSRQWSEWRSISSRSQTAYMHFRDPLWGSIIWEGVLILIEQRNHQWMFSLWDGGELTNSRVFNPDLLAAEKRSCAVLTTANPLGR
jgi:hypothetical protein